MTVVKTALPGGDDVNAVVLDIGASSFRAGFAGEDVPRILESSVWRTASDVSMGSGKVGPRGSPANFLAYSSNVELNRTIVTDPKTGESHLDQDVFEDLVKYSYQSDRGFRIDVGDSPLILTEPNKTNLKYRKTCLETSLETFSFPAVSLLRKATASAFASGKPSGLVVDIGASMTSVVPVYDGFVIQKPIIEHAGAGGDLLDTILAEVLKKKRFNVTPFYKNTANVPSDFLEASRMAVVRDLKHELCRMSPTPLSSVSGYSNWNMQEDSVTSSNKGTSVLPDGTPIDLGPIAQVIPELLFDPSPVSVIPNLSSSMAGFPGIGVSALECVANCDVDIRKQISSDVILVGGSSLFTGMPDRLLKALTSVSQSPPRSGGSQPLPIPKCKVTATPVSVDRQSSSWLGCSIVASCATFQQLWISKHQYQEDGFDRVVSRQLFW